MPIHGTGELCARERGGVSNRVTYTGYALQQVDEKGRVAIPSTLRATLVARTPAGLDPKEASLVVVAMHESDPCLIGYDVAYSNAMVDQLNIRAQANAGVDGAPKSLILREAMLSDTLPFDASGRFILPPFPRHELKIGKYAFFMGLGDYFEIWDPATLVACDAAAPKMKSAVRFLMRERGETL